MLDSLTTSQHPTGEEILLDQPEQHYPIRHPYQVLRKLPKDATPAQQDSAIQATFQPKEIHYSERPDTLHLPGQPVGKSINDVSIPQYYNETYFKNDSLYHPEIEAARRGMAGDPRPYRQADDDILSSSLLAILIITILSVSHLRHFFAIELKEFFAPNREMEIRQTQTSSEKILQIILSLITPITYALVFFNYAQEYISSTFLPSSEYVVMGIFITETISIYLIQHLLYMWVNNTFFYDCDLLKWNDSKLLVHCISGTLMMPVLLLNVYFGLSLNITLILIGIVLFFCQMLLFYKAFYIFFEKNTLKLQIFLYLCMLEIIPIVVLWEVLSLTANNLTITY